MKFVYNTYGSLQRYVYVTRSIADRAAEILDNKYMYVLFWAARSFSVSVDFDGYYWLSNLTFTSKLVEKVVASRFMRHIADNKLLPERQSAYRPFH